MQLLAGKWRQLFQFLVREKDYAELIKGSMITFGLRFLSFVLMYALHVVIATFYGAEELGVYALSLTVLDIGAVLVLFGTDTAVVRFISEYRSYAAFDVAERMLTRMIRLTVSASVLIGAVLWLSAEWLSGWFHDPMLGDAFRAVALILPSTVLIRLYAAAFRGTKQVRESIFFDMVGPRFGNLVLLLVLIGVAGLKPSFIWYSLAVAVLVNSMVTTVVWKRKAGKLAKGEEGREPGEPGLERDAGIQTILTVSMPMYLTAAMYLIMGWTDTIMLGHYQDATVVGIYSMVLKLSLLTSFAFISVNTILLPKISELYWGNHHDRLRRVVGFSTRIMFWSALPFLCLLAFFSDDLLGLFGAEFTVGSMALIILCIGQLVHSATGSVVSLLNMTGHETMSRNVLLAATAANLIGNFLLIPPFGLVGAAAATTISSILRDVWASRYAGKVFGFRTWYIPFAKERLP